VASAVPSLERATAKVALISGFGRAGRAEAEDLYVALCLPGLERLVRWTDRGDPVGHAGQPGVSAGPR
jgi:hypothetical protein